MVQKVKRTWRLNGEQITIETEPLRRLLDVLRVDLGLTGTKEGCGEGECGACTVLHNGAPVCACLIGAGQVLDGSELITVEGLEKTREGRVLQQAYLDKGAAQCGICIPGMLVSSYALLRRKKKLTPEVIREALAGNLCRCTGYEKIIEAVSAAAVKLPE